MKTQFLLLYLKSTFKKSQFLKGILPWLVFLLYISYRFGIKYFFMSGPLFCSIITVLFSFICYNIFIPIAKKSKIEVKYLWLLLFFNFFTLFLVAIVIDLSLEFALLNLDFGKLTEPKKIFFYERGDTIFKRISQEIIKFKSLNFEIIWVPIVCKIIYESLSNIQNLKKIEKQNLDFEIGVLKSQINPQFINGALENIKKLAISQPDRAALMVLKLSNATRYTLYETDIDFVPLQKELDFIINCIDLEETRLANQANINFRLKTNQSEHLKIAPMLLFPLIERAFKCIKSNCDIDLLVESAVLNLKIEADKISDCKNDDIEIIKKRLGYVYANKYKLRVIDNERIFKVELQIEL